MENLKTLLKDFFGRGPIGYEFNYFSLAHILPLMALILLIILLFIFRNKIKHSPYEYNIRITLAAFIIINEMMFVWDQVYLGVASISNDMPLHLCGIGMYVTAFMLLLNSKKIFEVFYFWILCGAVMGLITPAALVLNDYPDFGPMNFRYYQYFIGHSALIIFIFYMIFISKYIITFKSFIKSYIILNIYALFILFINYLIDANYLYLRGAIDGASLLDILPKFPYNIIVLDVLAFIAFLIAYLPWYFINKKKAI